jgi:hypothetical protein
LSVLNPAQGKYIGQMLEADPGGNGFYHGVLGSLQHRFSHGFSFLANYTWSQCIDDEDFVGDMHNSQYQNPYSRAAERGFCNFDYRQVFNSSIVGLTPTRNSLLGKITGNWQIAPLIRATTGAALTVTTGKDYSYIGNNPVTDRPNLIEPNAVYNSDIGPGLKWLNPAAFQSNAVGTFGNLGRDTIRGPGVFNFDFGLSRVFKIRESKNIEARLEIFNILNHTNLGAPNLTQTSSTFGVITTAADPRILQIALKYHF